jgi:hypothetical protein
VEDFTDHFIGAPVLQRHYTACRRQTTDLRKKYLSGLRHRHGRAEDKKALKEGRVIDNRTVVAAFNRLTAPRA